ncbi:MAG: DUF935 domain-containing protein [Neptuniibacter sp.]
MDSKDFRKLSRTVVTGETAGRATDPAFYSALKTLPNPDPILRSMGRAEEAYEAIMSDAHVIGEVRSIRSGFLSYEPRVVYAKNASENDPKQKRAVEICQSVLSKKPAPDMLWGDVFWNMATAVFRGYRVHEIVWEVNDGLLLPDRILDRPNRRFRFGLENDLRLLTKAEPIDGEETEPYKYLLTRHMPSVENPYGQAVMSSCFWPYTFKHGGWKFFYQFCERFGVPFPVGKYPTGTPHNEQQELLDALIDMIQNGVGAIPNDDSIELHSVSATGDLAQESLIHLANREMSKALTSQTLATEMKDVGSNAASKTHNERQEKVQESDRSIIEATMNELFALITKFNVGEDVIPPEFELYKAEEVEKERADVWEIAARIGKPSLEAFHKEMNIPMAEKDDDVLKATPVQSDFNSNAQAMHFNQPGTHQANVIASAETAIEEDLIEPIRQMLKDYEQQGKTLQQFLDDLPQLYSNMDDSQLQKLNSEVLQFALAEGIASV